MTQVHIIQNLAPGGIEHLVLALAESPDIHVFSLEGTIGTLADAWPKIGAVATRLDAFGKRPGVDTRLPVRLARRLRQIKASSVVTHHTGPLVYGGAATRLAGINTYAHVEHDAWHLDQWRRRLLVRGALALYRPHRVAVSRVVANAARKRTGFSFNVIPNGVDCDAFRPVRKDEARMRLGLPTDKRLIGCLGRLEHVKGFDRMVEAARYLPDDVMVVIWGEGSERWRLTERICELGLSERVIMPGRTDRSNAIYPALDLFCLPSRSEGLPLSMLEAQACGVPVVASDVGGVRDGLCPDTGLALSLSDREPWRLADALLRHLEGLPAGDPRPFIQANLSFSETRDAYRALEVSHA